MKTFNNDIRRMLRGLPLALIAVIVCYAWPLVCLARFALNDELYSHILLIPLVSIYLIWIKKDALTNKSKPNRKISLFLAFAGLVALAGYWALAASGTGLPDVDSLTLTTLSFVLMVGAICSWFLGEQVLRGIAFPLAFLLLMVPFPEEFRSWIETGLQYSSAAVALVFFNVVGTPVFNVGLTFRLSDISIEVAPQCSGIHSSLALFITSLVAGYLFLRSNWKRGALTLAVIPLAIVRNGFRVFTIGELCVHYGPNMIDSPIHHQGGPIFFALSLVPFLLFLFFLIKSERGGGTPRSKLQHA